MSEKNYVPVFIPCGDSFEKMSGPGDEKAAPEIFSNAAEKTSSADEELSD